MKVAADRAKARRGDADNWFGELPAGWDALRGKYLYSVVSGHPFASDRFSPDIGFPLIRIRDITSGRCETFYDGDFIEEVAVNNGDLLIGMDGDFNVRWWEGGRALLNQRCCMLRENGSILRRFLYYAIPMALKDINDQAYSTTVKHLSVPDLKNLRLPLPSIPEQRRIAARLDALCAEIDAQAAMVREEIAKLEEWRRSVISDAVTGGAQKRVDGRAEMPSRGVIDWFGKLPNGWKAGRVGQYYEVTLGKMLQSSPETDSDTLESYYCAANVHFDGVSNEGLKQMWFSPSEKAETEVRVGDILVVEGGAGAGNTALVKEVLGPTYMQNSVLRIRSSRDSVCNEYLCYHLQWLLRSGYIPYICNKATIPHFTKEKLAKAPLPLPPLPEQKRITVRLDALCAEADGILATRYEQLEKLDEWRRATIYEYTTGKKRA